MLDLIRFFLRYFIFLITLYKIDKKNLALYIMYSVDVVTCFIVRAVAIWVALCESVRRCDVICGSSGNRISSGFYTPPLKAAFRDSICGLGALNPSKTRSPLTWPDLAIIYNSIYPLASSSIRDLLPLCGAYTFLRGVSGAVLCRVPFSRPIQ